MLLKSKPSGIGSIYYFKCWSKMSQWEPMGLSGCKWRKWVPCLSTEWVKQQTSQTFSAQTAQSCRALEISPPGTGLSLNDSLLSLPHGVRPPWISGGQQGALPGQTQPTGGVPWPGPCSSNSLEFCHHLKINFGRKVKACSQGAQNKMRISKMGRLHIFNND